MPSGLSSVLNSHRIYLSDIDWLFLSRAICFFRSLSYHIHRTCVFHNHRESRKWKNGKTTTRSLLPPLPLPFQNTKPLRFVKNELGSWFSRTIFVRNISLRDICCRNFLKFDRAEGDVAGNYGWDDTRSAELATNWNSGWVFSKSLPGDFTRVAFEGIF